MDIEIRAGFCDPDGELLVLLDRPNWQRMDLRRRGEIVDEMVRVREQRGAPMSRLGDGPATDRCSTSSATGTPSDEAPR